MPEFIFPDEPAGFAKIKVVGVGGGGCNAVDSMFDLGIQNVDFFVVNSDLQALKRSKCPNRIQIGSALTLGRGCGADPVLGAKCMEEAREMMIETLQGSDIVFVTAGLGGGTGSGAAPVVAKIAKELGILTVSVVTRPFKFEGPRRMKSAESALERIRENSDTMIVVNNERLLEVVGNKVPMREAFQTADKVLSQAVQSISDLVTTPGLINVDFNDIQTIMGGRGGAVMGVGMGKGESRATEAVKKATSSPLLDKVVIDGATGLLICITGGPDMTLAEVSEATEYVAKSADPDAEIIFGAVIDESMTDSMRVTLIATGFSDDLHRRRELEKAIKTAPLSPAPRAKSDDSKNIFDIMEQNEIFGESQEEEVPAGKSFGSLSSSLRAALEAEDEAPAEPVTSFGGYVNGGSTPSFLKRSTPGNGQPANGGPVVRVAPSIKSESGSVRPARPAFGGEMLGSSEAPQKVELPKATVPQYRPDEAQAEEQEDKDIPAFLRRKKRLFD
ncbi:MAG: cell division protein FtsZ [Candidatus Sumerlaeia bacterium]|nr:cell division protein FtsZ [Candidatus Sumerlaeia bacterium]